MSKKVYDDETKLLPLKQGNNLALVLAYKLSQLTSNTSVAHLVMGFQLSLVALRDQAKFPIDGLLKFKVAGQIESSPGYMLEHFLAGKIFSNQYAHENLISFYRENDITHLNQDFNDLIKAALALTSLQYVEINFAMMNIIYKQNNIKTESKDDSRKKCQIADNALNFFLEDKQPKTRCLKYGYHGPYATFALSNAEYEFIRKRCETDQIKLAEIKKALIAAHSGDRSFVEEVNKCGSLAELRKAYSSHPKNLPGACLILKEAYEKMPCVSLETNTSAVHYATLKL